jgi:demethylmenaquinone methyltransferase/2-methoxy-6-polyprenyl-1,4-benzoquinol methylase
MQRLDPSRKSDAEVRRMFDAIAPRYDLLNRVLSAGADARWRRRTVARALDGFSSTRRADVLDVCCGTGDLALAFARDRRARRVAAVDFSPEMVRVGRGKRLEPGRPALALGDALRLPVRDGAFDVASIAFGLRNLVDPVRGIAELARALRPDGRLAILEFFRPGAGAGARLFRWYFRTILPRIGRQLSRQTAVDAYRYLPDSVDRFASTDEVGRWCDEAGFESIECDRFLFGAVVLVTGRRRAASASGARLAPAALCVA